MVNCNPETVSTDYDISDRLYFEPLTREDVLAIVGLEKPVGVIVQFGGQTPLKLAVPLVQAGVKLLGTSADAIDRAENRERFGKLLSEVGLKAPPWGIARHRDEARGVAESLGYPVLVRPSYVLGGRAMEVVHDSAQLARYLDRLEAEQSISAEHPLLIDHFLRHAIEVDVDAVCDGRQVVVAGVMEHIEEAGIHSGDSACALPPYSLDAATIARIEEQTATLARALGVVGLMNIQFAVQNPTPGDATIYVLEVNPRASRTVPFVSKATGIPWAKVAARVMAGKTLEELGIDKDARHRHRKRHVAVKEAVFPFSRFPGVDPILGPEMRSTGETMGIDADFPMAYYKSQLAAGTVIPQSGSVFITVRDEDKPEAAELAERLSKLGFHLWATRGTAAVLAARGISSTVINKVKEGRPHVLDALVNRQIDVVINTPGGPDDIRDSYSLRRETVTRNIPCFTTMRAAFAAVSAIEALRRSPLGVAPLQEWLGAAGTRG
jgi:carbamoyl-phosphate synthase large subunit